MGSEMCIRDRYIYMCEVCVRCACEYVARRPSAILESEIGSRCESHRDQGVARGGVYDFDGFICIYRAWTFTLRSCVQAILSLLSPRSILRSTAHFNVR